jgi:hypothetical protein
MDRTVREHIAHLEQRLHNLNAEMMGNRGTHAEANRLETEIRAAEMALAYYRKALELEKQISK